MRGLRRMKFNNNDSIANKFNKTEVLLREYLELGVISYRYL